MGSKLTKQKKKSESAKGSNSQRTDQRKNYYGKQGTNLTNDNNFSQQVNRNAQQARADNQQQKNNLARNQRGRDSLRKRRAAAQLGNSSTQQKYQDDRRPGNNVSTDQRRSDSRQQGNYLAPKLIDYTTLKQTLATEQNSSDSAQQKYQDTRQVGNILSTEQRSHSKHHRQTLSRKQSIRHSLKRSPAGKPSNTLAQQRHRYNSRQPGSNLFTEQTSDSRQLKQNLIDTNSCNKLVAEQKRGDFQQLKWRSTRRQSIRNSQKLRKPAGQKHNVTDQKKSNSQQLTADQEEKCYDPKNTALTFVDGPDDMDFLYMDYKSLRARMSCGHTVTPMSLTNWCRHLLDEGGCKFYCGQNKCDEEWSYQEVCKMALLTSDEKKYFENKLFSNAKEKLNVKSCPSCKSSVMRTDVNNLCVECTLCTEEKSRTFMFCWQCLRAWNRLTSSSEHCGNPGCNGKLEILKKCPIITFTNVAGVKDCPSIRACPTCGFLVEHSKAWCKSIVCDRCKVKFCFVCLRLFDECSISSCPFKPCVIGTARRQTSIPVWKK